MNTKRLSFQLSRRDLYDIFRITASQRMGGGWLSYPVQREAIREVRVPRQ